MKLIKPTLKAIGISLLCVFCISQIANAINTTNMLNPTAKTTATAPAIVPPAPNINARGYVLMDANSGKVIASKNMNTRRPPASLTKLMTLYVTSQALANGQVKENDLVRISEKAWRRGGSRMFLKLGSHVPLIDLIHGIIVASGNDACVATAEYIAGSEASFAQLMNQTAERLNMKNSHYVDSTGLPKPNHYSTPYDIAILTRALIKNFPDQYKWYKQKWITYNGIRQPNRNRLLWRDSSVDGLKTGHTDAAGYCLVSSGLRNNMRLIAVVMGTPSDEARANDSEALLNWGFRFYKSYKVADASKPIAEPRVWMGRDRKVALGLTHDLYITIPAGDYSRLKATMTIQPKIEAPIEKGKAYGDITVTLDDKLISKTPVIALQDDERGGFWSRVSDHVALFFKKLI